MKINFTLLGVINMLFVQWLFIRIVRFKYENYCQYGIMGFVVPLSGWESPYIKIWSTFYLKLTKKINCKYDNKNDRSQRQRGRNIRTK